jgi:hypothetical protein
MLSYVIGVLLALAYVIALTPLALLSMFGSGLMGFWILYNLTPVPIAFGASGFQAFTVQSLRGHRLAWVLSSTFGWLSAAVVALSMPEALKLDFLSAPVVLTPWLGGALLGGLLQWATVLRSSKGLLWIPANVVSIILVAVAGTFLFRLTAYAASVFPSAPHALSMIWFVGLGLALLVLLIIGLACIAIYGLGMGAAFGLASPEANQQAA